MRHIILTLFALLGCCISAGAAGPDDDDFVRVSLLVASPGPAIYQTPGHAALRMECPTHGLDNVFTFEVDASGNQFLVLGGGSEGLLCRVSFEQYSNDFAAEGRGLTEMTLNLTPAQDRRLWQLLDEGVDSGMPKPYNIRWNQCLSELMVYVREAIEPDRIVVAGAPHLDYNNGFEIMRHSLRGREWQFEALVLALGAGADDIDEWTTRTVPTSALETFGGARIVSPDGTSRPMVTGTAVLFEPTRSAEGNAPRPWVMALWLLGAVIALCVLDLSGKARRVVRIADYVLLGAQTVASILLIIVAAMPTHISSGWHWLFIVFNPLPLVLWLAFRRLRPEARRARAMQRLCLGIGIVDGLFAAVAPFATAEVSVATAIVCAAIALRALAKAASPCRMA